LVPSEDVKGVYKLDQQKDRIKEYFSQESILLSKLEVSEIVRLLDAIETVRRSKGTVYLIGNGGSASTASHFATDIGVGSIRRANPVKVLSLCDNASILTALANDLGYDSIFEQQLQLLASQNDLLIVFSASGNSVNLLRAVNIASEIGLPVFSITGFNGGKLRELTLGSNIHVQTPEGAYGMVEDIHLAICHVITECIRTC
jgi:D-sedoheptulose 7-phosphate isomerase